MFRVANAGKVVAALVEPRENVPEVRFNVPVEVSWNPPSLKRLLAVTSPTVRVVVVVAMPRVTPTVLLALRILKVVLLVPPIVCAAEPLKFTVPVPAVNVPLVCVQSPPILIAPDPTVRFAVSVMLPVRFTVGLFVFSAVVLPTVQSPLMASVPAAGVFVPPPENVRLL
jgi:hypothetical protein